MKLCREKEFFTPVQYQIDFTCKLYNDLPYWCDCTVYILFFFYMYVFLILHCKKGNYSRPGRVWVSDLSLQSIVTIRQNNASYFSGVRFLIRLYHLYKIYTSIQGGSDKSGILKIFLENLTEQLKIFRFYWSKKKLGEGHIENQDIQWNGRQRRRQPRSWTWTFSRPSPRCPFLGSPSMPSCSGSGPRFCCEALHWPITQRRHT
jgi:hypothetical protein